MILVYTFLFGKLWTKWFVSPETYKQISDFIPNLIALDKSFHATPICEQVADGTYAVNSEYVNTFEMNVKSMTPDQKQAFKIILAHLNNEEFTQNHSNPLGQLRMFLSGEGGVGKSFLVS